MIFNRNEIRDLTPDIASFAAVKQTMLESLGDNDKTRMMILACEEMFSNIVNYSVAMFTNSQVSIISITMFI